MAASAAGLGNSTTGRECAPAEQPTASATTPHSNAERRTRTKSGPIARHDTIALQAGSDGNARNLLQMERGGQRHDGEATSSARHLEHLCRCGTVAICCTGYSVSTAEVAPQLQFSSHIVHRVSTTAEVSASYSDLAVISSINNALRWRRLEIDDRARLRASPTNDRS